MDQTTNLPGITYRIRVREAVNRSATDWFGEIAVTPEENGETRLVGQFADQAALRGFMDRLWNLNFTILLLERIENGKAND